ncbi:hypothetical protein GV794_18130 [Nocardia cyriacigeorgica]|uniref:Secreted protein n=1 Tax=Nocardia cyriacigeorgica TaxID=135487 RepID=A0A6P1DAU6_9NOCA|nr:hypothetical protein [Nocardia cyriacigeorgica]NEW38165.1 hypothetical protein [Nocardia cyriacigeorgica]NEW45823.1 hypothetical protein [Nocardia cyriacigeorgica]NEW48452.1 hypothetical protein [Nocardia cyriacigeorgica]NEW57560.1 hypothetical protein [Nocardia cyriacigeorgica]
MQKLLATVATVGAIFGGAAATAGAAQAHPTPPPSLCTMYTYPASLLVAVTGSQSSPLLRTVIELQPVFCGWTRVR